MKKNSRKITVALISIFMSILIMSSMALPARAALPAKYDKDVYIADMLSNNYRGYGIEGAPESYKKLQYYTHPKYLSASEAFVDSLLWDEEFLAALMSWETATFNPSDAVGDALKAKDFYKVILYNILDCEFKGTDYLQKSIKSFDALHSNLIKGVIDVVANYYEIEYEEILATDFGDLSEDLKNAIIDSNKSVYKAWDGRSSRLSFLSTGINFVGTLAQFLDTLASYFALCALEEDYKFLLTELYNNCSIADLDMKAALLEVKNVCSATLDEFMASVLSEYTLSMSSFAYKEAVGFFWDSMVATVGSGVGIGVLIGQAIGRPLSNLLFSTDQTIDQFYAMKAMVNFENLISSTVVKLQSDYKSNPVSESAKRFLKAVDLLFATYDLSSDYAAEFCNIIFSKKFAAAISKLFIKTNTCSQEKISKVIENGKKGIGFARESLLDIEFYKSYIEVDYPEVYRSENLEYFDYETAYGEIEPAYYSYEDGSEAHYGIFYRFIDGGVEITGYESTCGGEVVIPGTIEGKKVISIAPLAFNSGDNITKVTIPDTVTDIGNMAFWGCESLESVNIPSQLTKIRKYLFADCKKLKSIVIPDSVTVIEEKAFKGCEALTELIIGNGVTEIGSAAFHYTENIVSLTVPADYYSSYPNTYAVFTSLSKVTELVLLPGKTGVMPDSGDRSEQVRSLTIKDGVKEIGTGAFRNCLIDSVIIPDSVTSIGDYAFYGCSALTSIKIPDGVTSIGDSAFGLCSGLTGITIPDSVTSIERDAFRGCTNLMTVVIPSSVKELGVGAFYNCSNISDLTVPIDHLYIKTYQKDNTYYLHPETIFHFFDNLCKLTLLPEAGAAERGENTANRFYAGTLTEVIIMDGVKTINEGLFSRCSKITSITIPESVINIDKYAFEYCYSLENVTMGNKGTRIGACAFYACTSLKNITIGENAIIGDAAFTKCYELESVIIPDSVTGMGYSVFKNCENLKTATIGDGVSVIGEEMFAECTSLESITIGNGVNTITENAFKNCEKLKRVYIDDMENWCNIEFVDRYSQPLSIDRYANPLYYADELYLNGELVTEIVITSEITDTDILSSYKKISKIIFDDSVTKINDEMFYNYSHINSVIISDSVTSIGDRAFAYCDGLESITIGNSVSSIGEEVFYWCDGLKSIAIPSSVTSIGKNAFYWCYITNIYIEDIKSWLNIDFADLTAHPFSKYGENPGSYNINIWLNGERLTDLIVPEGVKEIKPYVMTGCDLKSLVIPEGVTNVGERAFLYCNNLDYICLPSTLKYIGDGAFGINTMGNEIDKVYYAGTEEQFSKIEGDTEIWWFGELHYNYSADKQHYFGNVIQEPTYYNGGIIEYSCSCGYSYEEYIPKNTLVTDTDTGASVEFNDYWYDEAVEFNIVTVNDSTVLKIIGNYMKVSNGITYDIKMLVGGSYIQPTGKLTVKLPVPVEYNPARTYVYYVNTATNQAEKMDAVYDNGYMVFETDHFSYYVVVEEKQQQQQEQQKPQDSCSCNCHKSGFSGFIWKILRFFYKLFKTNPVCSCGMAHY